MKRFLKECFKFLSYGIVVLLLFVSGYFIMDPFRVLYSYNNYSEGNDVTGNRDYISTETFLNNKDSYHYDSFIFGSSRTLGYDPLSWKKHLPANASPFVFDATMESIYGVYKKVKFLDSTKVPIKHALFIFCRDYTFDKSENSENHLLIKHPKISGESTLYFQSVFFRTYFNFNFLGSFYAHKITGNHYAFMNEFINEQKIQFDPVNNHLELVDAERILKKDPALYMRQFKQKFFFVKDEKGMLIQEVIIPQEETVSTENRIDKKILQMLQEMKAILEKHQTDYQIILHPLLDKVKFSLVEVAVLKDVFGDRVHDFTGKNKYTSMVENYYDWSHCRPVIGDRIMEEVYESKSGLDVR